MLQGASAMLDLIFLLGMCLYWLASFYLVYHLLRFGIGTLPKKIAVVFLAGALFLSLIAFVFYNQINLSKVSIPNVEGAIQNNTQIR